MSVRAVTVTVDDQEARLQRRVSRIRGWLVYRDEMYAVLLSRKSETASESGWDESPRERPCECRSEWRRGNLCLLCDNTRMRPCWHGEEGIDPYALGVKAVKGGFTAKSAGDESVAQKRSASMERLNTELQALERDEAIRDGREAPEDSMLVKIREVSKKPRSLVKIEKTLHRMRADEPVLFSTLPRGQEALEWVARETPGRIMSPD